MILAFAVPVEIPNRDVLFTYNFEANYNLPTNITMYNLTPPSSRNLATVLNRTYIYNRLEEYINSFGSSGRQCILRMICDVAKSSLHHNGLLGSIFDVLFT
ncbi:hypothetical protein O3M35_008421 [Rhynocoris fuscipes]|uniref:Uncharacterized protein n=1 Tax=Rhynocoris fuscipes TaxID=488301 RepID=A0AAW1D8X0_9HEMI